MTMKEQNLINLISEDETSFLLDKEIWEKYDMNATKDNVIEFIRKYKEARTKCMYVVAFSANGLTSKLDPNKIFSLTRKNNGGFAESSNNKLDDEDFVHKTMPIINRLKKSFTTDENTYYECCLEENNSEEYCRSLLNDKSKNGLKPIKNSCILKIAIAFRMEIKKEKNNKLKGGDMTT